MWDVPAKEKAIRVVIGIFILGLITVIVLLACGVFTTHTTCSPCATCEPCLESDSCATTKKKYEELLPYNQRLVERVFDGLYSIYLPSKGALLDNIYFRFHNSTISMYRATQIGEYEYDFKKLESITCSKFRHVYYESEDNNNQGARFELQIEIPQEQSLNLEQYNGPKNIFIPNSSVRLMFSSLQGIVYASDYNNNGSTAFMKNPYLSLPVHLSKLT